MTDGFENNPRQRAFLAAYRLSGIIHRAAEAVGVHRNTVTYWRESSVEFKEAFEQARSDAADHLEDEAVRRARDGVRRYRFDKHGKPLRHPDKCDSCGRPRKEHLRLPTPEPVEGADPPEPRWGRHANQELGCEGFEPAPYFEHEYSDSLLARLLVANRPERFGHRSEVTLKGILASIDFNRLSDEQISRLANGEHPLAVLSDPGIPPPRGKGDPPPPGRS